MKLWKKIYLFSLIIFLGTLSLSGVMLISKIHNDSLKEEVDKGLSNQEIISSQLYIDYKLSTNSVDSNDLKDNFKNNVYECMGHVDKKDGDVEILDKKGKYVYNSTHFKLPDSRNELKISSQNEKKFVIRTLNGKQYLFVSSLINLNGENLSLSYIKDISNVYKQQINYYTFFIYIEIFISIIFAVFMFFFVRIITKPINNLIDSTKKISQGEYSERVKINSKDEFGSLSNNFNLMADTIEDKINELEENNLEKQNFINNLTHELKTPLTSIIGYANLLRTSKYNEKVFYEASDYIYKEGKRMEQMAFKMMELISVKAENIDFKEEKIMDIISEAKKSLFYKLSNKSIELIVEGEDFTILADKDLIKIMICNFVDNSIKASKSGSKIFIKLYNFEKETKIEVIDSGIGIPKESLDKIGQPFYMVDKSRSRKNNGAGIGFSICRRIAEAHNAEIEIKSEINKGTKVSVIFERC
ncbi:sensor histidine kinase [Clostridium neuense]|uniref:histidine kinase n=1 Tax=Clostridium neuense TaxID=1728934 RepID=A0ABW8TNR5_9CLOT